MNNLVIIIAFDIMILSFMFPLYVLHDYGGTYILAALIFLGFLINKRLDDIEDLLEKYRDD